MKMLSVIMPAYNAEKYIAAAIDSILGQTYGNFEFIIINDCSKDRTEEIVLSYDDPRIVYLKNGHNLGVAATLNKGLSVAKGEYIARMDADDISLPERFAKQVTYLQKHNDCGICGCNVEFFGEAVEKFVFVYSEQHKKICGDLLFNSPFAHPGVMLRASVLKENKLQYDSTFEGIEDYYLWYQLLRVSRGYNLPKTLLRYRIHSNQVTQVFKGKQYETLLRFRRMVLIDYGVAFSDDELDVFSRVCFGQRKLTAIERKNFVALGKKLIACQKTGKNQVKWSYAALNYAIEKESDVGCRQFVSWMDPMYRLMNFVYKIRRAVK